LSYRVARDLRAREPADSSKVSLQKLWCVASAAWRAAATTETAAKSTKLAPGFQTRVRCYVGLACAASIMNPFLSIPRQALAELLQACGSPLTPEQFLESLPDIIAYRKFPSRARAAAWSKYFILVVAVLGLVLLPFLGDYVENAIIVAGLATVTFFEFRVHRYFSENNPKAPSLGFRNQACFAAGILIYCLYHVFVAMQVPVQTRNMIEENNLPIDLDSIRSMERIFYLGVAMIAGGVQFALAWYYRSAQAREK